MNNTGITCCKKEAQFLDKSVSSKHYSEFAQGDSSVLYENTKQNSINKGIAESPQELMSNSNGIETNHLLNGEVSMNGKSDSDLAKDNMSHMQTESTPPVSGTNIYNSRSSEQPRSGRGQRSSKRVTSVKGQVENWMLVVAGDPGTGKSAVMAKTVSEARKAGFNVFYHFVGSCPTSIYSDNIVKRLCRYLLPENDERLQKLQDEYSSEDVTKLVHQLMKEKANMLEQLLIIIDAVNQLTDDNKIAQLDWLPAEVSGHSVRCIVSVVKDAGCLSVLRDFTPQPYELMVSQLNTSTKIDIVQHYLGRYSKRLDPHQLALLTKSEGAQNALWLTLSCEELRVFGIFEKVTDRIKSLPEDLDGLLAEILDRLVKEDDTGCVEKTLCLLYCSQNGLPETELQQLLGDVDSDTALPMLTWGQVRRTLKPFLRNIGLVGNVEWLDFFHQAIAKAVKSKWVKDGDHKKSLHLELADFYQYHGCDTTTVVRELPYQLQQARSVQRLMDFLRTDKRAIHVSTSKKAWYIGEFRCKRMIHNPKSRLCSKVMMCHFCQLKFSAFSPSPIQNKDSCVLCGGWVHFKREQNMAYLCQFHMPRPPPPPSCEVCCVCNKIFPGGGPHGPVPGYICVWCKYGGLQPICVKVMTETDN
ncbi:TPR repeat-containing protein DDB_G0287407-like [Ptychodera flava]|uniref:TPR repeat-containing protein DDB_G0287407-like n=1 Tax=Ptychodera flava TaxID=63121 RepID=UPI00396A56D0